jgi:diguanylate cyclase (GGDEF)-like protein/PAS domain S-box-containing protein
MTRKAGAGIGARGLHGVVGIERGLVGEGEQGEVMAGRVDGDAPPQESGAARAPEPARGTVKGAHAGLLTTTGWLVVAAWVAAGLMVLAIAVQRLWVGGWPDATATMFAVVFGALMAASWIWPITLFVHDQSDVFDVDEGFFVLMILLVPPDLTVLVFALVAIVAQAVRRRAMLRIAFNAGRVITATGAAALVFVALNGPQHPTGYVKIGAALAGAGAYFLVNTAAIVAIMTVIGTSWRDALFGGMRVRLLVVVGTIDIAIPTALLLSFKPAFLPLALLPLLVLRYLGEGHFYARDDRIRLRGLFEATLDVNRSIGEDETRTAVLASAGSLLRSSDVTLGPEPPSGVATALVAPVEVADRHLWLAVSGRRHSEPFDEGDRALLDALASVGGIALSNADLYAEVERQKDALSVITRSLGEGVCAVTKSGDITFMNPAGAGMLGWTDIGVDGRPRPGRETPRFLLDPALRAMSQRQNVMSDDTRFERPDGSYIPVTMTASPVVGGAQPSAAVIVFRDTSERKAFEEQLARHAFQDPLTGLANRRLLLDHLDHALLQARRSGNKVAVLFGDVDRFKVVNDNLGHQVGDELLRVIAERLRRAVRPGDTLSRFGGDEFVAILEGVQSADDAGQVADRILEILREPVMLTGGHEVVATMSMGLALSEDDMSRDDLLHDADVAMYRAKERGRGGQVTLFDVDRMGARSLGRLDLDTALHHAVERDEVQVYFQPLVSLTDGRIVSAEALVRWDHPEHGILSPTHFMELAEDNGTILAIGTVVLEQACRYAAAWTASLGAPMEVGVNLSARQFQQANLEAQVAALLETTGIAPSQLCLEITESLAMDDVDMTSAVLTKLHNLGLRLAIDDFGTGHSSLGYLAQFPIDVIKIDQSFAQGIDQDPVKSAIVSAVVALSQAIGSTTVVEGVETAAELEQIASLGCDLAQGFYFSRPLPGSAFEDLVRTGWQMAPATDLLSHRVLTG